MTRRLALSAAFAFAALVCVAPTANAQVSFVKAKELYSALQEVNLTLEEFQGRKYIRLTQFKHLLDNGRLDGTLRWVAEQEVARG